MHRGPSHSSPILTPFASSDLYLLVAWTKQQRVPMSPRCRVIPQLQVYQPRCHAAMRCVSLLCSGEGPSVVAD